MNNEICKKCEEIDNLIIKMEVIEDSDPIIGDMGNPVIPSYYKCPKCNKWEFNPSPSANLLAQRIDKEILDKIVKDWQDNKV